MEQGRGHLEGGGLCTKEDGRGSQRWGFQTQPKGVQGSSLTSLRACTPVPLQAPKTERGGVTAKPANPGPL